MQAKFSEAIANRPLKIFLVCYTIITLLKIRGAKLGIITQTKKTALTVS